MNSAISSGKSKGHFISEWFGQRIYPTVRLKVSEVTKSKENVCPFLSKILALDTPCVKAENSRGVCTISGSSNGPRQDWLVCPYRVIDSEIVKKSCATIFGLAENVMPKPVPLLKKPGELDAFKKEVLENGAGYLFFQDKLGGEISVLATPGSPEMAFDVTIVEVTFAEGAFRVERYGILELQTMDFHGSYKHAVGNLRDALRLHGDDFPEALQNRPDWAGKDIEGPNIANVFKRTFYQMMLKFELAGRGAAAGTVLALPKSVWDSWQPFLGQPELSLVGGVKRFKASGTPSEALASSFICVFDIDASGKDSISPVFVDHYIQVSPEELVHHAFTKVPDNMLAAIKTTAEDAILSRIRVRLGDWWPDLGGTSKAKIRKRPSAAKPD
jgi:hypothetical protein